MIKKFTITKGAFAKATDPFQVQVELDIGTKTYEYRLEYLLDVVRKVDSVSLVLFKGSVGENDKTVEFTTGGVEFGECVMSQVSNIGCLNFTLYDSDTNVICESKKVIQLSNQDEELWRCVYN